MSLPDISIAAKHYSYRVIWSATDQEYIGLCVDFPSLSWLAVEPEQALGGIVQLVAETINDLQRNEEPIPKPHSLNIQ